MSILANEMELSQTYKYHESPSNSLEHSNNLSYALGVSTHSVNHFDHQLNKLVNAGILKKLYDFTEQGYREALYNFTDNTAQISFEGNGRMNLRLFYNY